MRFTEYNQSLPDGVQSTTRSLFTTPSKLTSGRGARQRTVPLPATTSGSPDRTTCFKAKHSIISGKAARCRRAVAVAGVLAREAVSAGRTRRGVTGRHVELSTERVAGHHMEKQVGRGSTDDHTYARPCCRFSQSWWSH